MQAETEEPSPARHLLVTCDEIATKGGNRNFFEKLLRKSVWRALGERADVRPGRLMGRSRFVLPDDLDEDFVVERVSQVPGVATFSIARPCPADMETICARALEEARQLGEGPFAIEARRSYKDFPLNSQQIEQQAGAHVVRHLGLGVDLTRPAFRVHVLVTEQGVYVYSGRWKGPGGLAIGSSGKVVSLLSGGLDSPVASYKMFLRGCRVVFCHFLNRVQDPLATRTKIEDLVEILTRVQQKSVLYVVPFQRLQQALVASVPEELRMIAYRRVMMRVAARVAAREGCEAVVTGDSVGQVASQTLSNLETIWSASELPVLAPLIGLSKLETVEVAKRIGTFETSNQPYPDCCQFMIARHPATRSAVERLLELEARMADLTALEEQAFRGAELVITHFPETTGVRYPGEERGKRRDKRRRRRDRGFSGDAGPAYPTHSPEGA